MIQKVFPPTIGDFEAEECACGCWCPAGHQPRDDDSTDDKEEEIKDANG